MGNSSLAWNLLAQIPDPRSRRRVHFSFCEFRRVVWRVWGGG